MRLRESGMPDEALWETLFDTPLILDELGIDTTIRDVVEVGCGYGTFTIPIAQRIGGTVFALDIDPAMTHRTQERAIQQNLPNVVCRSCDIMDDGCEVPHPVTGCCLFNILHGEDPVTLLSKSAVLVQPGGWVWAIHWKYDPATPRGPSIAIRPRPEQLGEWAEQTGVLAVVERHIELPPWH